MVRVPLEVNKQAPSDFSEVSWLFFTGTCHQDGMVAVIKLLFADYSKGMSTCPLETLNISAHPSCFYAVFL